MIIWRSDEMVQFEWKRPFGCWKYGEVMWYINSISLDVIYRVSWEKIRSIYRKLYIEVNGGTSGYNWNRYILAYFKWITHYIIIFLYFSQDFSNCLIPTPKSKCLRDILVFRSRMTFAALEISIKFLYEKVDFTWYQIVVVFQKWV